MQVRQSVRSFLPWGAALWAVASGSLVALGPAALDASARTAFALDAATSALAVRPLSQHRALGWWLIFGPVVAQPVLAALDLHREPERLPKAAGRTLGAALGAVALLAIRQDFGSETA